MKPSIIKTLVAGSIIFALWIFSACSTPRGGKYYIPRNYSGWICVSYNVRGASALPVEEGFRV
ncbi:hypothetical protein KKF84_13355, partial [Myxococcota bacterium]|nr:hypothetical protein [Myxococcota bacterium]